MTHIWGHIECGSVGNLVGTDAGRVWPFVNGFIVASKLFGPASEDMRLDRQVLRIMREMAKFAEQELGGEMQPLTTVDGDYRAIIVGDVIGQIPMEPIPVHTDGLITYAVGLFGLPHARQSYIINELDIMRYEIYSAIHLVTGGEIHHNSYA